MQDLEARFTGSKVVGEVVGLDGEGGGHED